MSVWGKLRKEVITRLINYYNAPCLKRERERERESVCVCESNSEIK